MSDLCLDLPQCEQHMYCLQSERRELHVYSPGSLVIADQVRYMVYRVTSEDCNRPDLGWDSFT